MAIGVSWEEVRACDQARPCHCHPCAVYTMLVENARYRLLIRFLVKPFAFDPRRLSLERLYAQASYCLSSDQP